MDAEYGAGTSESTRWVKVKTQIDATNWKEAVSWFDGLGRNVRSQSIDAESGDVFTLTCYDNMGRMSKASNPFRGYSTQDCTTANGTNDIYWTLNSYDDLGRIIEITGPDNSIFETSYSLATSGSHLGTVQVIRDEANKTRRIIRDVFENIIRVDEPDDSGNLGSISSPPQQTVYDYDLKGNLIQIVQGVQTRVFGYDSLNRLINSTNPESGTFIFTYDPNGNLITKKDARNITTTYSYDALNRVVTCDYSDSTPDIVYTYDDPLVPFSKERLTKVSNGISTTENTAFDTVGRVTGSKQTTDGQSFVFGYGYNLDGELISQTYPSGKVVQFDYDANGDLERVGKQIGSNLFVYANSFSYAAHGEIERFRFGNGKWETTQFNSNRQITQVGLGHSAADTGLWKVNYDYGEWNGSTVDPLKNNGNLARQIVTVPTIGGSTGFSAVQTYTYDTLDRIQTAAENISGNQTWKQTFTYDRFGNRNFDTVNTTILSTESIVPKIVNPEILTANNQFKEDQDGDSQADYLYDTSGNITKNARDQNFTYDAENRQLTATGTGLSATYSYDGNGKRVKLYNAVNAQTTIFVYDSDGDLAAEYTVDVPAPANPTITYLTQDALGSVRVTTNSFGEVKSRRDFLPFGDELYAGIGGRNTNQKYSASADDTRKKFATYQRDIETGLDFAQSRYYSPMQGRFTSPDEFKGGPDELFDFEEDASDNPTFYADLENPQSLNKYQYGYNNPYKFNDPDGHCPLCVVIAEIALTVYDISETVKTYRDPNASTAEKIVTSTGTAIGIIAPGGGYGAGGKAIVKRLFKREVKEAILEQAPRTLKKAVRNTASTPKVTKQARLKQIGKSSKESKANKGWIKQERNQIRRKKRKNIRVPPGKQLAHPRGREAAKGYDHSNSSCKTQNCTKRNTNMMGRGARIKNAH